MRKLVVIAALMGFLFSGVSVAQQQFASASATKTFEQALQIANKEAIGIGYNPSEMRVEYGSRDGSWAKAWEKFKHSDNFPSVSFQQKPWEPFRYCTTRDPVSSTCFWVLVSKTDDDIILW